MLVVEDRHRAAARLEGRDDLVEEPLAGVLDLSLRIDGVFPVLADRQDPVDAERLAAVADRLADRRVDRDAGLPGHRAGHVALGELIDVQGDDLDAGLGLLPVEQVGSEEVLHQHVGMAAVGELGDDDGDLRPPGAAPSAPAEDGKAIAPRPRPACRRNSRRSGLRRLICFS